MSAPTGHMKEVFNKFMGLADGLQTFSVTFEEDENAVYVWKDSAFEQDEIAALMRVIVVLSESGTYFGVGSTENGLKFTTWNKEGDA